MRKKITFGTTLSFIFIAITVTFCLTMILSARLFEKKVSSVNEKTTMYSKLAEVDQVVRQHYYTTIDDRAIVDGLSSGYVNALGDTEARYYRASEVTALQNLSKGKLIGIGLEVQKDVSGYFKIVKVDDGSPANIAEIVKGDMITHINDASVVSLNTEKVSEMLKGSEGVGIKINYLRDGEEKSAQLTFSIYDLPTISYTIEGTVGYIKISTFADKTAGEVDYAVKNLISQGATSFVIDLRFNHSKEFQYASEVADIFVKEGTTMFAQYIDDSKKVLYTSDKESVSQPVSIIVNDMTGYAAEMFAVILKDMSGAKFVGTKTMGKCTMQTLYRLSDGSGVEITTARLVPVSTPDYHGVGLLPDYEKTLSSDQELNFYDLTMTTDPQIRRAIEVAQNMVSNQ